MEVTVLLIHVTISVLFYIYNLFIDIKNAMKNTQGHFKLIYKCSNKKDQVKAANKGSRNIQLKHLGIFSGIIPDLWQRLL